MILCPLLPAFFSKFPIILWNIVLALSFCHLSFLFPCPFFLFFLFLSARALFSWYFFPIRPYLFPPPWGGGGGGGIFQYIDPWSLLYQLFHLLRIERNPDPAKWCGSDPIPIRIHNTAYQCTRMRGVCYPCSQSPLKPKSVKPTEHH